MSRRIWRYLVLVAALGPALAARAQRPTEPMPSSPRGELPFSTQPERLPGPPRAEGELPGRLTEPPSTLPGRMHGPPRAEGYAPISPTPRPGDVPGRLFGPPLGAGDVPPISPALPMDLPPALPRGDLFPPTGASELPQPPQLPAGEGTEIDAPRTAYLTSEEPDLLPKPPRAEEGGPKAPPLVLDEVLASAEQTYPLFQTYLLERAIASGDILSSFGNFDLSANVDARNWGLGYYKRNLFDVFLEQPTMLWGTKFFLGYRLGVGDWPIYYQYLQTRGGGAYVGGLDLPILRGGRIDAKRAKLWQAEIERRKVEPYILEQRIELIRKVSKAYWAWVAAGKTYQVYDQLLLIAEARNRALRRQVELGAVAAIELTDATRVLLQRQNYVVAAKRQYQQAAIALSLFYRSRYGFPQMPDAARLPAEFPPVQPPEIRKLPEDVEVALRLRPETQRLRLQYEKAGIDLDLARNDMLPGMNFYLYSEQNFGAPVPLQNKGPFILETSILFEVPVQRRFARGRIQVAQATLRQIRLQEQFARDRIVADVQDAMSALLAAHEQLIRYRESVEVTTSLRGAEQQRFELGSSNVLFVNIREQAVADAQVLVIEARAKYFSALADYRAALAVDAPPPGLLRPAPPPR